MITAEMASVIHGVHRLRLIQPETAG